MNKLYAFAILGLMLSFSIASVSATHSLSSACQYDLNGDARINWSDFRMQYDNFRDGTATRSDVFNMLKAVRMSSRTHLAGVC